MPIPTVIVFKDSRGIFHDTEEKARHSNGMIALSEKLNKEYPDGSMNLVEVLKKFQDWWIHYQEHYNA